MPRFNLCTHNPKLLPPTHQQVSGWGWSASEDNNTGTLPGQYQNTNVQNTNDHNTNKMVFWSFFLLVFLAVGIMNLVGEHLLVFWLLIGILIAHWYFDRSYVLNKCWHCDFENDNENDRSRIRPFICKLGKSLQYPSLKISFVCLTTNNPIDNKQSDRLNWFQMPVFGQTSTV